MYIFPSNSSKSKKKVFQMLEYNDITHIDTNNLTQTPTQAFEQDTYTGHIHYCIESGVQNL